MCIQNTLQYLFVPSNGVLGDYRNGLVHTFVRPSNPHTIVVSTPFFRQTTQQIDLKLGGYIHYVTPKIGLNFGHAPPNSCYYIASVWSSSFCALPDHWFFAGLINFWSFYTESQPWFHPDFDLTLAGDLHRLMFCLQVQTLVIKQFHNVIPSDTKHTHHILVLIWLYLYYQLLTLGPPLLIGLVLVR